MMEWISVKDRLPDCNDKVLVYDDYLERVLPAEFNRVFEDIYDNCESFITHRYITHWMPLPEPPKEGK